MDLPEWERLDKLLRGMTEPERQWLINEDYVYEYDLGACELGYLADKIRDERRKARPVAAEDEEPSGVTLGERAGVVSLLVAEVAEEEEPALLQFRDSHLGGVLLAQDRVDQWIADNSGPATKRTHILEWGIAVDINTLHRNIVAPDSPADELRLLAAHLSTFYGWQRGQAVAFVLCGQIPALSPLTVREQRYWLPAVSRIVITVDPTVPPAEVEATYRRARMRFGRKRFREISERNLRTVAFATERKDLGPRALLTAWNKAHPESKYPTSEAIARVVRETRARVLDPYS